MIAWIEPTSLIVAAVFALTVVGVAYGLKTRKGSGINEHPRHDSDDPVPDPESGSPGNGVADDPEHPGGDILDQRGKK